MITLQNLCFSYRSFPLLNDISLHIKKGEAVALAGPNGAGKTTLLKIIAGLIQPLKGSVSFTSEKTCGLYLPNRFFYNTLTLIENLEFYESLGRNATKVSFEKVIQHFDLKPLLHQKVGTLSLGEKARGLLARLFLIPSSVYLLDEPLLALDPTHLIRLVEYLKEVKSQGTSLVIVSHDLHPIQGLIDRTLSLQNGRLL